MTRSPTSTQTSDWFVRRPGQRSRTAHSLICIGVIAQPAFEYAVTFDDSQIDALLHGLVQDVEDGYINRLGIVMPAPLPWPLPAYELALMVSERAWDMQVQTQVTVLTPEERPLAVFGAEASLEVSRLLARRHVDLVTSAYCEMPSPNMVRVHPGDRTLEFDRVVALPVLQGPRITGLPQDGGGFIPVDDFGRVRHVDRIWAAGDATDFPVKHGGVAAQMADTAAQSIASVTGACEAPPPFDPEIEGVLLTGATPRQLRGGHLTGGHGSESELVKIARGARPPKIAARYLTPHLDGLQSSAGSGDRQQVASFVVAVLVAREPIGFGGQRRRLIAGRRPHHHRFIDADHISAMSAERPPACAPLGHVSDRGRLSWGRSSVTVHTREWAITDSSTEPGDA